MFKAWLQKKMQLLQVDDERRQWVSKTLGNLKTGSKLLDAGAGEQQYKIFCNHLDYQSQDFCQYDGKGNDMGLQTGNWNVDEIDIVCDITNIPVDENEYDAVLCTEVFEHIVSPVDALEEFRRILKPGGELILTAPFASLTHFAPFFYATGFSRYWYEHFLPKCGFEIVELVPNGDWFSVFRQEVARWPKLVSQSSKVKGGVAYLIAFLIIIALSLFKGKGSSTSDLSCFGWHCVARKL